MTNLEIHCPYCSALVHVRQENLGNLLQCPGCPGKFRVPSDLSASASPPAAEMYQSHGLSGSASGQLASGVSGTSNSRVSRQQSSPRRSQGQTRRQSGYHQRPSVPQMPTANYSAYACPNQQTSQNQNMVLMVGAVVIGVILVLFVAMLVVLGSGQLNRSLGQESNSVAQQSWEQENRKEANAPEASEPNQNDEKQASIVPDKSIRQNENGDLGFIWDPNVKNSIRGSSKASESGDDEEMSGGFRSSPTDYGDYKPRVHKPMSSTSRSVDD